MIEAARQAKTVAAIFALLFGLTWPSRAEIDRSSGNHMLEPCRDVPLLGVVPLDHATENDAFVCMGIAIGVWYTGSNWFCWRVPNATVDQVIRISVKFMDEHPAMLNQPLATLIMDALLEAWPCPAAKRS